MGAPNDRVATLLEADAVEHRREAASELVETATATPGALTTVVDRIAGALTDPDDRVRTAVARVCFEVGTRDPAAVEPLRDDLLDALGDPVAAVRANIARPVAEVVVRDPVAHRDAAATLRDCLDDRSESVRQSAAWALEWLATRDPTVVPADRLGVLLGDDHPPVRKHGARLCALCPRADRERYERLVDLLSDESIPVRRAACLALGAAGADDEGARSVLGQVARTDLNDTVRLAARRALREATYETTAPVPEPAPDASVLAAVLVGGERALGDWLRVDAPRVTVRNGRFRGVVTAVDALQGTITLRNEPVGYRIELSRDGDGWRGTYEGTERTGTLDVPVEGARKLDTTRTPLRYAVEGDRIEFEVEGTPHSIEVTDRVLETGQVRGENWMQGYAVEFRPERAGPVRALFERGRAFEATDLVLRTDGDDRDEGQ